MSSSSVPSKYAVHRQAPIVTGAIAFISFWIPVVAWLMACQMHQWPFNSASISRLHAHHPVYFFIDAIPILLVAVAYGYTLLIGKQHREMQQHMAVRERDLRRLSDLARKIGQNDLSQEVQQVESEGGPLAQALEDMRKRLKTKQENERQERWMNQGRLEISRLLQEHKEEEDLLFRALEKMAHYVGAIQGALYVTVAGDEAQTPQALQRQATLAYQRRKYLKDELATGEGLIGEAALDQVVIHRTELPENYVTLRSGLLGDQKPGAILIVPLVVDQQCQGVVELAAFERFSDQAIKLLQEVSTLLARHMAERRQYERTEALLEQSRDMTQQLQEQQQTLQKTARAMEQKQSELSQAKEALERQINEVQHQQQRERAILENASEIIAIFAENESLKYISPSVRMILGYQPSRFGGLRHFADALDDGYPHLVEAFERVLQHPEEDATVAFQYPDAYGKALWIEARISNQTAHPAIEGIVFNMRNITDRKQAELEQQMRARMESLSENSPNIILRLDLEGKLRYLNPAVEESFGIDRKEWLDTSLLDTPFQDDAQAFFTDLIAQVESQKQKVFVETTLEMKEGVRSVTADGIPEYGAEGVLETVLLVMRDITESKRQYEALRVANQKVSDSINYARRIQDALIPESEWLHQWFRGALMINMPRDVVSGDFPWMSRRDGYLYVAAADCTGHGVPGAIMSAIGNLLLRDIMRQEEAPLPSQMLMALHRGIVDVLRQESDSQNANDGLDIALMRVDLDHNQLLFSGAHRPLFYLRAHGEEVERLRGDRFSIGGVHGRGRTKFTDQRLDFRPGDRFYMFSDGLTDQFNAHKTKLGPKRVREMIWEHRNISMMRQGEVIREQIDAWMEGVAQLDDILMVGIEI